MLDTVHHIETPENIDLEIRLAGPAARALAYVIDLMVRGFLVGGFFYFFSMMQSTGVGLLFIVSFLIEWLYPVFFEVLNHGQTPGKQSIGIRVLNDDGTPVNWSSSLLRNLLRFVDFMPAGYGVGLVSCCLTPQFKRLGDLAAGTIVTYVTETPHPPVHSYLPPLPPTIPLVVEEQRAVLSFVERSEYLTESRQHELANILTPLTKSQDEESVRTLRRIAIWLMGAR